jgi:hypothetical protein
MLFPLAVLADCVRPAGATSAPAARVVVGVGLIEWVTLAALLDMPVPAPDVAPLEVLAAGHRLQVFWADTPTPPTEVIEVQPLGDRGFMEGLI